VTAPPLVKRSFAALGGAVTIEGAGEDAADAVDRAAEAILDLQRRLTRFEPDSELSRLNADSRRAVPGSPVMQRFAGMVGYAGHLSNGLVDATCLDAVERAGYTRSLGSDPVSSEVSELATDSTRPPVGPAGPDPARNWMSVLVDRSWGTVVRPPGVRLDSGGIGKGMAADIAAEALEHLDSYAVSCVGDLRFGGTAGLLREIQVEAPAVGSASVATLSLTRSAVATSGVTRRSWIDSDGRLAHHLIDPRSGRPAFTGVLQVTAVAPTGVEAEVRAKSALLSGPKEATGWLVHGGVMVQQDGEVVEVPAREGAESTGAIV